MRSEEIREPDLVPAERHACRLPISLETLQMAGASPWLGWTGFLSADEIGLVLSRRFEPGTPVSLVIEDETGAPLSMLGRITAIEAISSGWQLICQLIKPIDNDELEHLLRNPPPATARAETLPEITSGEPSTRTLIDLKGIRDKLGRLARQ